MLFLPSNLHDRSGIPPLQQFIQNLQRSQNRQHPQHQQNQRTDWNDMRECGEEDLESDCDMNDEEEEENDGEDDYSEELKSALAELPHGLYVDVLVSNVSTTSENTNQNNLLHNHHHHNFNNGGLYRSPPGSAVLFNNFSSPYGVYYTHQQPTSPLVEPILELCHRHFVTLRLDPSSPQHASGVNAIFEKFWKEFSQVIQSHPECHESLIDFLGDFLEVVENGRPHWFEPKEKLGRGLLGKELKYWFDEVGNEVQEHLGGEDQLDDAALDHHTVKHFVNYFSFLASLTKNRPDLEKYESIIDLPRKGLQGRDFASCRWRDATILAWEKVLHILGTGAYDEFRDQGWSEWEMMAGEISFSIRNEPRRNTVKQTAERVHLKMKKLREEATTVMQFPAFVFTTNSPYSGFPAVTCYAQR